MTPPSDPHRHVTHDWQISEPNRVLLLAALYAYKGTRGRELAPVIEELEEMKPT